MVMLVEIAYVGELGGSIMGGNGAFGRVGCSWGVVAIEDRGGGLVDMEGFCQDVLVTPASSKLLLARLPFAWI